MQDVLAPEQAALYLGLSASTLSKMRVYGNGPGFMKLGRSVRYLRSDLDAFMTSKRRNSTSMQAA